MHAVRAQHPAVAACELVFGDRRRHIVTHPDAVGENVAHWMVFGTSVRFRRQHRGKPGVVARHRLETVPAKPIRATVTHVSNNQLHAIDERSDDGRAHSEQVQVVSARVVDPAVRQPHCDRKSIGGARLRWIVRIRPCNVATPDSRTDEFHDRVDRHPRGHFPSLMPAHPVSDDEKAKGGIAEI